MRHTIIGLVLGASLVVKVVMLVLVFFSVVSWAIIIQKWRLFANVRKENELFYRLFRQESSPKGLYQATRALMLSPLARVFRDAYTEGRTDREELRRSIKRFVALESARLERYLNFLATTGSTTPFIGLFGTVWGIMVAFQGIGTAGSASLAVVAPGIAEALIATAMGLAAAIPAVIGYNYYLSMAGRNIIQLEDFAEELLDFLTERKDEKARD